MHSCRIEHKGDFYGILCHWWDGWDFPNLPYDALPNVIFVSSYDDVDTYAMPVYLTDTNTCFIGFVTGNPKAEKLHRKGALSDLNKFVEDTVRELGYSVILTSTSTPVLKKLFEDQGYMNTGKNYNEYLKIL